MPTPSISGLPINRKEYLKHTAQDWKTVVLVNLRPLQNGYINIPAGTALTATDKHGGHFTLEGPPCALCGVAPRISKVEFDSVRVGTKPQPGVAPSPLANLVDRFSQALLQKLEAARVKYGYTAEGWAEKDWLDTLVPQLLHHVDKGDPLDVAAFSSFAWHHGMSLTPSPTLLELFNLWRGGGWVPLAEGAELEPGEYLVMLHDGSMINDYWVVDDKGGRFECSAFHSTVTHYRPILQRPQVATMQVHNDSGK